MGRPIYYFFGADNMKEQIHLSCEFGEIIDLYGLCLIDGIYHIFFLYNSGSGHKKWGHYSTTDFLQFRFSSGEADIVGYKAGKTHYFANTSGENVMMELVKTPDNARRSFLSLPRKAVLSGEELLKFPAENLCDLREYKRKLTLREGEIADSFGPVFEAILNFSEKSFSFSLHDDILIECENGNFSVRHNALTQNFETENFDSIHIFSDIFSVEIFVGGKALSLPTRKNEKSTVTVLKGQCRAEIYMLKRISIR